MRYAISRARAVQDGGKVRGRRVGWAGWLRRAHGGCGGASGAPSLDLVQLARRRRTRETRCRRPLKCRAPGTSPGPMPAASALPSTWERVCTGRGYLPRKERAAWLSWENPPWRYDLRAWANVFLPVRARRPGRSGIRRSFGAAPSRNGERSWSTRAHARPMPGRRKAMHFPNCAGPHSKPPRERRCRKLPMSFSRHAPGNNNPRLRPPSPRRVTELESHGPRSGQMPTRKNNPPRRRLLWARSGAAFRAAFGQGLGRSANAPSRRCAAQPSRCALKSTENPCRKRVSVI